MNDQSGRIIDYLRLSVTDRCDLRCLYCMPEEGVPSLPHSDVLRYEEILRLVRLFAVLGIRKIRLTGGEPLVRKDVSKLAAAIKRVDGIERLTLTTNGMLLEDLLPALVDAGLDGVNISIDALDEKCFSHITRRNGVEKVIRSIDAAVKYPGLQVKLNCVPTSLNLDQLVPLTRFAIARGIPLRFIELMPIGEGKKLNGLSEASVIWELEKAFGKLIPLGQNENYAQCRRFRLEQGGRIGFISPLSHKFCKSCNRVRLTADGKLKTCLQYDAGLDLKKMLDMDDQVILQEIRRAVLEKPACHHFGDGDSPRDEQRKMSQIGG